MIAPAANALAGTTHTVVRGDVEFTIARGGVQCMRCGAIAVTGGRGDAVQSFFGEHGHKAPASIADAPATSPALERLQAELAQLGPDEIEVVLEVATGLRRGRAVYGELTLATDPRDLEREALDEVRDGLVYAAMGAVRRRRAREVARG